MKRLLMVAFALGAATAQAHLVVDIRMSITAPQFVAAQRNFTYRVVADDLNFDNAFGVIVTTTLPAAVKFSSLSASIPWRCSESRLTVTCSAEQLGPGPNPIDITVVAPNSAGRLTATTSVSTLGSLDPNPRNDQDSNALTVYDPLNCRAEPPLISGPDDESSQPAIVPLAWSAVPGAQSYTIYTTVEGGASAPVLVTDQPTASLIAEPGRTEWWIEASFGNCPPVASSRRRFTASITLARNVVDFAGRSDLDQTRDGKRGDAAFRTPFGLALSPAGEIYVSDETDSVVRKIAGGNVVSIVGVAGWSGSTDGQFAQFRNPRGLAVTPIDGFVLAADTGNHEIRILYTGGPFVPAFGVGGSPSAPGYKDAIGGEARFNSPSGLASTERGILYVADTQNHVIRKLTPFAFSIGLFDVTTVAGVSAGLRSPQGLAVDSNGVIYVADTENHAIRKIVGAAVSTIAGEPGVAGSNDGRGAHFNRPIAIAVDSRGNLYVTDRGNNSVRRIAPSGLVTTIAAGFNQPAGIVVDPSEQIYVADSGNHMIRLIELPTIAPPPPSNRRRAVH